MLSRSTIFMLTAFAIGLSTLSACGQKTPTESVDRTKVCMVDNQYKGELQLTTTIDGKTFYGCCDPCIETLNDDADFRFSEDPFSGKKINRAEAFIARVKDKEDAIQYFESEENYKKYIKTKTD